MNHDLSAEWIIGLYDDAGADGQEHKTAELREAIKPDVMAALAELPRDLETEAELVIDMAISPARKNRRNSLRKELDYLLSAAIEEDGAYIDPLLEWVVPLGTNDGLDKKLRHWDADDFNDLVRTAYRQAAEQTAAAAALDHTVQQVVTQMKAAGASLFGDLWVTP